MTQTETVTADQLQEGDKVWAFGLEWEVYDVTNSPIVVGLRRSGDFGEDDINPYGDGATFERILQPKKYQLIVECEERVPEYADSWMGHPDNFPEQIICFDGKNDRPQRVVTSYRWEELDD